MLSRITKEIWYWFNRAPVRVLLLAGISLVLFLFFNLLEQQKGVTDADVVLANMQKRKQVQIIKDWTLDLQRCSGSGKAKQCISLKDNIQVSFPNLKYVGKLSKQLPMKPNTAIIKAELTQEAIDWLKEQSVVVLVAPRLYHYTTREMITNKRQVSVGMQTSGYFPFSAKRLINGKKLALKITYPDENNPDGIFGPMDSSFALTTPSASQLYGNLSSTAASGTLVSRQLEIGLPLLLTAIALVLDHSMVFIMLSFFAVVQAIRSFLSFSLQYFEYNVGGSFVPSFEMSLYLQSIVNGLNVVALVGFVFVLFGLQTKRKYKIIFSVVIVLAFVSYVFSSSLNIKIMAPMSDLIATTLATIVMAWGWYHRTKRRKSRREDRPGFTVSMGLYYFRMALLAFALWTYAGINFIELIIEDEGFIGALGWAHKTYFPSLIIVALMEIGSTTRKMQRFSSLMVEKAMIDKDLQIGREIQQHLLPDLKGQMDDLDWRGFYHPAIELAGDWFDMRKLTFQDGTECVLVCLVDVTGHGVGAALITTAISSHWSIWCEELEKRNGPRNDEEREHLLAEAPAAIHKGLIALKRNSGCTAAFVLIPVDHDTLTFCTAGHPGIFVGKDGAIRYVATQGTRPGFMESQVGWRAKTVPFISGDSVHVFSDGIVPPGEVVARWLKTILRTNKKTGDSLTMTLLKAIHDNRRAFRKDRKKEDDMTLLVLHKKEDRIS